VSAATATEGRPRAGVLERLGLHGSVGWLAIPGILLVLAVFAFPTVRLLLRSFTEGDGGLSNYSDVLGDASLVRILVRSVWIATVVTAISLVLGFIYTYVAVTGGRRLRSVLLALVGLSLFVSVVVRGYSWLAILDRNGALHGLFDAVGLESFEPTLVRNFWGVVISMVQYGIPFMVIAIYDVMRRIDPNLSKAAATLGAPPHKAFLRVFLPLSLPGVIAGSVIVFVTTLGYYILPSLLGGPQNTMIGQVIADRIQTTLDWASATALAGLLLLVSLVGFAVFLRITRRYSQAVSHA
jgi:ABC-type spermidine/putrescine transport system permease subunit I